MTEVVNDCGPKEGCFQATTASRRGARFASSRRNPCPEGGIESFNVSSIKDPDLALCKRSCHQPPQANFFDQDPHILSGSSNLSGENSLTKVVPSPWPL